MSVHACACAIGGKLSPGIGRTTSMWIALLSDSRIASSRHWNGGPSSLGKCADGPRARTRETQRTNGIDVMLTSRRVQAGSPELSRRGIDREETLSL